MKDLRERYLSVVQQQTVIDLGPVIYGDARLAETVYHVSAFPIDSTTLGVAFEDVSAQFRALRLKDEFVSIVSHELRTPLNGVIGLAQLLAMTRLDAEQASYVEAIEDSGRALAQVIDEYIARQTARAPVPPPHTSLSPKPNQPPPPPPAPAPPSSPALRA